MSFYGWKPYVPVAARRAKAARMLARLKKKGLDPQPVEIAPRRPIAATFWGKGWCDHMESFSDFDNRLPRGRTYVRNGSVCHLEIGPGRIEAIVSGSELYQVEIVVKPLPAAKWKAIRASCSGKIGSLLDLLRGQLASSVMEVVCHRQKGLFPLQGEISFQCDCPDWADMCKHVAAVLYGVGARLDQAPEQLFLLRGVDHGELVDIPAVVASATRGGSAARRIDAGNLAEVFGIELAPAEEPVPFPEPEMGREEPASTSKRLPGRPKRAMRPDSVATPAGKAGRGVKEARPGTARTAKPAGRQSAAGGKGRAVVAASAATPPATFPKRLTGPALRTWRDARGLTQAQVAARLGVTASSISQWENKGRKMLRLRDEVLAALHEIWEGKG